MHRFSRLLCQILKVGANCFGRALWIKKLEETGSDGIPILLVDSEGTQIVPPGLGPASKGAVKLLDFPFVVSIDNLHSLN
jgi:hypothetical protein